MIAEVDPTRSVRSSTTSVRFLGFACVQRRDCDEILETVLEERRRELWLQGNKLGDMLRVQARADLPDIPGYLFDTGLNQRGQAYGPETCYPLLSRKQRTSEFLSDLESPPAGPETA